MNEEAPVGESRRALLRFGGAYFGFAMPPWLEHAPWPPLLIVPSVHFTIAVFPAVLPVAFGLVVSAGLGGFGAAVFGLAAVVAGLLSLFDVSAFFTPP
jgi:hypothetical protein